MIFAFLRWFFKLKGWKIDPNVPPEVFENCLLTAAPHTTWWDMLYTFVAMEILGVPMRFTIADKYAVWPIKKPLERMGAIWIDRSPKSSDAPRLSYVEAMIELFKTDKAIAVIVTPEGSRSYREKWKTGFYHVAKGAGVPIGLGYLDYGKKLAGVGGIVHPSEDMEEDMRKVMAFYATIQPKFPENFSVDKRYYKAG
jgi:1-acyl-sn-glycerol-3-phosphate acyltransferase